MESTKNVCFLYFLYFAHLVPAGKVVAMHLSSYHISRMCFAVLYICSLHQLPSVVFAICLRGPQLCSPSSCLLCLIDDGHETSSGLIKAFFSSEKPPLMSTNAERLNQSIKVALSELKIMRFDSKSGWVGRKFSCNFKLNCFHKRPRSLCSCKILIC